MIVVEVGIHDNLNIVGCQTFSFQRIQNKLIAALRRTVRPSFAIDNVVLMNTSIHKNISTILLQEIPTIDKGISRLVKPTIK